MTDIQKLHKEYGVKYWRMWSGLRIYYKDKDTDEKVSYCLGIKTNGRKYLYMFTTEEIRKNCLSIWYDMYCLLDSINEATGFIYFVKTRHAARIINNESANDEIKFEPVNVRKIVYESVRQVDQEIKESQNA